jgi:hypothetical protein
VLRRLLGEIRSGASGEAALIGLVEDCEGVAEQLLGADADDRLAASYPFLTMLSVAVAGWLLARQFQAAGEGDSAFLAIKKAAARFYLDRIVPEARGLKAGAMAGALGLYQLPGEDFAT